ncbi:MAG: hypothetical protein KBD06_04380 [Candidatus Pacebacteria bacterium]|nr:hypothetical protein [Candidatus Paceibacterota bacterium]
MQRTVRFDDAASISENSTGDTWSAWGTPKLMTSDVVAVFGGITDNHQWIHEDPIRCMRESPYGRQIVHGLLLVAMIPALLPDEGYTIAGHSVRIVRGIDNLRLPSPAYPDEFVRMRVRNMCAYPAESGKGTIVERDIEVWSLNGKKPAVTGRLKLQYF